MAAHVFHVREVRENGAGEQPGGIWSRDSGFYLQLLASPLVSRSSSRRDLEEIPDIELEDDQPMAETEGVAEVITEDPVDMRRFMEARVATLRRFQQMVDARKVADAEAAWQERLARLQEEEEALWAPATEQPEPTQPLARQLPPTPQPPLPLTPPPTRPPPPQPPLPLTATRSPPPTPPRMTATQSPPPTPPRMTPAQELPPHPLNPHASKQIVGHSTGKTATGTPHPAEC
ncbi:arp2/3 complex-activating protein rickA-like [Drosophila simulans]|uniref:arp2/3 complex-activating protein rickA-like n=1 Tax=Drosophila simulans TaxID=7240 RepID=UPI001D0FBD8E|nr:arp2/3 complex-activating protein rickA-like [Drosophila simulans]